jgi:fido (protein-threonine AMPylation protein)
MHVETRVVGKRRKYYLAASIRSGRRVRKVRIYLGDDLSAQELARLRRSAEPVLIERAKARRTIPDPYRTVLSRDELEEMRRFSADLAPVVRHLGERDWEKFTEDFSYDTNAIEGSTVSSSEVGPLLREGKWPLHRTRDEISETYGVAKAVAFIRKTREHLSVRLIRHLHRIVFGNSLHFAGNFRKRGEDVAVVASDETILHRGADSTRVKGLVGELVVWYRRNRGKYPPLALAAVVHNQFENIHPFRDGNGRVGRLLLNNILLRHGLPPLNIELRERGRYYRALQEYQKGGNLRPTIELFIFEYRRAGMGRRLG